ncbi:MAG TPA: Dam family site-specific DNA-(adenine-N6)-methyltransferase [Lacipirellulaceae bacterium]|nr:Dam family site-specific DNA-(adenine-N6)-methyltransferase [Lacipirellulaceae bacterium]HMP05006.1 Dam family site-specific DNA-(adenine-N6)-methyltransferase [Lacipirellulaceae bacterium]
MALIPFLKWPGGKRWLVLRHADILPTNYGTYFEPFLGAGSVFFHLQPKRAVLGDINGDLIEVFRSVAWRRKQLEQLLLNHHVRHGKRYYYQVRKAVPSNAVERAARLLYLNRTCFNGMYRVNRRGEFNVPKGVKTAVLLDTDDFAAAATLLRRAQLRTMDFENLIDEADRGDFVFADPPYVVGHNNNGFIKYNEQLFGWKDQIRLANALKRARKRGVIIVATNAAHKDIASLFDTRGFGIRRVQRFSSISGAAFGRCQFQELLITANCD